MIVGVEAENGHVVDGIAGDNFGPKFAVVVGDDGILGFGVGDNVAVGDDDTAAVNNKAGAAADFNHAVDISHFFKGGALALSLGAAEKRKVLMREFFLYFFQAFGNGNGDDGRHGGGNNLGNGFGSHSL